MPVDPQVPIWNPSESAVVDPPTGKKVSGWIAGERPAARFFNWLFNRCYQWIAHLALFLPGYLTWDGNVTSMIWLVTGGPGVLFALTIQKLHGVKVDGAVGFTGAFLSTNGPTDIGVESIEGAPGINSLFENTVYYVYAYASAGGVCLFEISTVVNDGAFKTADRTRRFLFPFYTNRRTVSGTDYGLPIPFIRHGNETRYLLNAATADRGLTIYDATLDELTAEVGIAVGAMLPFDCRWVLIRVSAYVSTAFSGGRIQLYPETGTDSEYNAVCYVDANDQANFYEAWVPLHSDQTVFLKINRTRAATPMTTQLKLWVVGYRSGT